MLHLFLLALHANLAADVAKLDVVCRAHLGGGTPEPVTLQAVVYKVGGLDPVS